MKRLVFAILLTVLLTACGLPPTPISLGGGTTSPAVPVLTPVRTARTGSAEAAIVIQRSGGLAGISQEWSIFPDGRIVSSQGGEYHASAERVSNLIDAIVDLGFFDIPETDPRFDTCRDCFVYRISVSHSGRARTLTFVDGSAEMPPGLRQVASVIDVFLAEAGFR